MAECKKVSPEFDAAKTVSRIHEELAAGIGLGGTNEGKPGGPPLKLNFQGVDQLLRLRAVEQGMAYNNKMSVAEGVRKTVLQDSCVSVEERVAINNMLLSAYGPFYSVELTDTLVSLLATSYHQTDSNDPNIQKQTRNKRDILSRVVYNELAAKAFERAVQIYFIFERPHLDGTAFLLSKYIKLGERVGNSTTYDILPLFDSLASVKYASSEDERADAFCNLEREMLIVSSGYLKGDKTPEQDLVRNAIKNYRQRCPKHKAPPIIEIVDFRKRLSGVLTGKPISFSQFTSDIRRLVRFVRRAQAPWIGLKYLANMEGDAQFTRLWNRLVIENQMEKPLFHLSFNKGQGITASMRLKSSGTGPELDKLYLDNVEVAWVPDDQALAVSYLNWIAPELVKMANWLMDESKFKSEIPDEARQWADLRRAFLSNICGKALFYSNHFDDVIRIQEFALSMNQTKIPMLKAHYYLGISYLARRDWSAVKENFQTFLDGVDSERVRLKTFLFGAADGVTPDVMRKLAYGGIDGPDLVPVKTAEGNSNTKLVAPPWLQQSRQYIEEEMWRGMVQDRDLEALELMAHYFVVVADWHLAKQPVSAEHATQLKDEIELNRESFFEKYDLRISSIVDELIGSQFNYEQAYEDLIAMEGLDPEVETSNPFKVGFTPDHPIIPANSSVQPLSPREKRERIIEFSDHARSLYNL